MKVGGSLVDVVFMIQVINLSTYGDKSCTLAIFHSKIMMLPERKETGCRLRFKIITF